MTARGCWAPASCLTLSPITVLPPGAAKLSGCCPRREVTDFLTLVLPLARIPKELAYVERGSLKMSWQLEVSASLLSTSHVPCFLLALSLSILPSVLRSRYY